MKKNIFGTMIIIVGCCLLAVGGGLYFKTNTEESKNNGQPSGDKSNEEKATCDYDAQNGLFQSLSLEYNEQNINLNFLKCVKEKNTDSKTSKKYQSDDGNYEVNLTVAEESSESYYKKLKASYEENKLNYSIKDKRIVTFEGIVYYTIKVNETNGNNNEDVKSQNYNIIYPIDKKHSINIQIVCKIGKIDDGFFTEIENSITITDKDSPNLPVDQDKKS